MRLTPVRSEGAAGFRRLKMPTCGYLGDNLLKACGEKYGSCGVKR